MPPESSHLSKPSARLPASRCPSFMLINKSDTTALSHLSNNATLAQSFDIVLTGCTVTLSVLDSEIQQVLKGREDEEMAGFCQRAKYVWNEDTLKSVLDELRGQREALNLLVTVVQRLVARVLMSTVIRAKVKGVQSLSRRNTRTAKTERHYLQRR